MFRLLVLALYETAVVVALATAALTGGLTGRTAHILMPDGTEDGATASASPGFPVTPRLMSRTSTSSSTARQR